MDLSWNHNAHYHGLLLDRVPRPCARALDVGCGDGRFARLLAGAAGQVDAIDPDPRMVDAARSRTPDRLDVRFTKAALGEIDLEPGAYGFVSAISSLHHLPAAEFGDALRRLEAALAPGGVLAVLGLYREETANDRAASAAVLVPQWAVGGALAAGRALAGVPDPAEPGMPVAEPEMGLRRIAAEAGRVLPGVRVRRLLFWRYRLFYTRH
ncbi:class I SAM-dependent methyltransferase [Nocardiopsis suaedae]|uniref:Class I SAM-dependent methyltransferase n=1 Tax=Nocardiopsis suaedae TaxID=3018444 RepID=A0ABT4TLK7_9ACTN|nr:class I SAM-dependent methyltransferase [Nocardiopsis suaedae]MDA2805585.1 class I SAM-dependent methyltransferase [Nocardiopsis suaedae]